MAPVQGPPLSLRPFPVAEKGPKDLADFIARVNALPGGFRSVTETKLQEEIRTRDEPSDDDDSEDVDMSEREDDADVNNKDPNHARMEVLRNLDIAGNTAMLTLDSLSLLISKQNPTQASLTLSQQLRDMVGIGTLGSDKLHDSNATAAKREDEEQIAIGWTLMEVNKIRDSAEEAATFLEAEIEAEGKYWQGVMAVKQAGWSICKVPKERHTLGVRFGFSEAASEFKANGLAAMRRSETGSVELDCGRLGGTQERIVVSYERSGQITGRSILHNDQRTDSSLQDRVLSARNTIFAQELWGELVREARSLAAYNVRPEGKKLTCELDKDTKLIIDLIPIEACSSQDQPESPYPNNTIANAISASLHVLLTYAHRCNELLRIRPMPPHVPRSRGPQTYTLLRPIIARIISMRSIESCTAYVGSLVKSLQNAGLPSSFTLHTTQTSPVPSVAAADQSNFGSNQLSSAVTIIRNMLQPIDFTVDITILSDLNFTIRGRTYLFPVTATYYHIITPPESPLPGICAPYADGYPDNKALSEYLRTTTERAIINHILSKVQNRTSWALNIQGTSISEVEKLKKNVQFSVQDPDGTVAALVMTSKTITGGTSTDADSRQDSKTWKWNVSKEESSSESLLEAFRLDTGQTLS